MLQGTDKDIQILSRTKLTEFLKIQINEMMGSTLDYAEVGFNDRDKYKKFKSLVLRFGNDVLRNFQKELASYNVNFVETSEDLIVFKMRKPE